MLPYTHPSGKTLLMYLGDRWNGDGDTRHRPPPAPPRASHAQLRSYPRSLCLKFPWFSGKNGGVGNARSTRQQILHACYAPPQTADGCPPPLPDSYVWLPLVSAPKNPGLFTMPALNGGGNGDWKVAEY